MRNDSHTNDNQGQGGQNGRFALGSNEPGGKHDGANGGDGADHLKGTDSADTIDGGTGDDVIVGRGGDDTLNGGEGNDTYSHSGAGLGTEEDPGDGTDTIIAFDKATETEGVWEIADRVEFDSENFDFSAVDDDGVTGAELLAYIQVVNGVIQVDLDGLGGVSVFEDVVDTSSDGVGIAVEVGDASYVWDGAGWDEA